MNRGTGQGARDIPGSETENMAWERANGSAFQNLLGYRLALWAPDHAVIEYDVDAGHLNRSGVLHGGVLITLLDTAAGYAGCHCAEPGRIRRTLTLSLTTNFVASVTRGRLSIEGRRTGGGRTIFFAAAEARDDAGRLLAGAVGTFRYIGGSGDAAGMPR